MKKFYIITNETKDDKYVVTKKIKDYIESHGRECILCKDQNYKRNIEIELPKDIECAIVIGGDGTFIQASRRLFGLEIPMLGVNLGTLGYLTEVELQNVETSLDKLLAGEYVIENRMMLHGSVDDRIRDVALNDIVITRNGSLRIINFKLYVNGQFLNSFNADGIIVSTPTGSTAYNLSAGGPIVEPTAELLVLTPICSHALNSSSIILSPEDEIVIEIGSRRGELTKDAAITFDGSDISVLQTGDKIRIKRAWETAKIVKLSEISFLETLREKMKGN